MRVDSSLQYAPRRVPSQLRGQRRVTALLHAAAAVIAEAGYDAATMAAIAAQAGASIGSLYQFFPNKESVTHALRLKYGEEARTLWASLEDKTSALSIDELAARLVNEMIVFLDDRPALFSLLDAPGRMHDISIRNQLRRRLAHILCLTAPFPSREKAATLAAIAIQIMKGMNDLYLESGPEKSKRLVGEFQQALACYLKLRLAVPESPMNGRKRKRP